MVTLGAMKCKYLFACALFVGATPMVRADVIFNNLGAADSFNPGAWEIRADNNISRIDRAKSFVPGSSYNLTSIEVALYHEVGDDRFTTLICADAADAAGEPGAVLGSSTQSAPFGFTSMLYTASFSGSGVSLSSGSRYWVVVQALDPSSGDGGFWWASSPTPPGDTGLSTFSSGSWTTSSSAPAPALRVSGNLAPEPGALGLLCLGLLPLSLHKRRGH